MFHLTAQLGVPGVVREAWQLGHPGGTSQSALLSEEHFAVLKTPLRSQKPLLWQECPPTFLLCGRSVLCSSRVCTNF